MYVVHAAEGTTVPGTADDAATHRPPARQPADRALRGALPGALQRAAGAHGPGTREHVLVTQGALRTGPVDRTADLRPGDYAGFAGDEMHLYEAGPRGARALLIMQWATQP